MTFRDDLFRLIKSLSPAEVRYFKVYANQNSRNGSSQNLLLFEAISAQNDYDEVVLKQALADSKMVKQLAVAKSALFDLLLKLTSEFHKEKRINSKLHRICSDLEMMLDRNLLEAADRRARKALEKALLFDQINMGLEIMRIQMKVLKRAGTRQDFEALNSLQKQEEKLVQQLLNESQLRRAHDELLAALSFDNDPTDNRIDDLIVEIQSRPVFAIKPENLHFNAAIIYYYIHIFACRFKGMQNDVQAYFVKMIELWEARPERIAEEVDRYVITLISHLEANLDKFSTAQFQEKLEHLRSLEIQPKSLAAKAFHYAAHLELNFAINKGISPTKNLEKMILDGLKTYSGLIDPAAEMAFYSNLAILYFLQNDFARSLKWTNRIYNSKDQKIRADIRIFAASLRMITYFELGEFDLASYLAQSSRRNLYRKAIQHPVHIVIVRLIQTLTQVADIENQDIWQRFNNTLNKLIRSKQSNFAGIHVLETWALSKLRGISMIEIVQTR